jgi:hypothetical protein
MLVLWLHRRRLERAAAEVVGAGCGGGEDSKKVREQGLALTGLSGERTRSELGPVPELKPRLGPSNSRTPPGGNGTPARPTPSVRNELTGTVSGVVIQTGSIDSMMRAGVPRSRADGAVGVSRWRSTFQRLLSTLRQGFDVGEPLTEQERYGPCARWEFAGVESAREKGRVRAAVRCGPGGLSRALDTLGVARRSR